MPAVGRGAQGIAVVGALGQPVAPHPVPRLVPRDLPAFANQLRIEAGIALPLVDPPQVAFRPRPPPDRHSRSTTTKIDAVRPGSLTLEERRVGKEVCSKG